MSRFEDVVNREFLKKYLPDIRPEYGVVDEKGRLNYKNLEKAFYSMDGENNPCRFTYALIHGMRSMIPSWNVPGKFRGAEEAIYKYCLDKGITWEDALPESDSEDILL